VFEDAYVPYGDPTRSVSDDELHLKPVNWSHLYVGFDPTGPTGTLIPGAQLENGNLLIPANRYDTTKENLERHGQYPQSNN
jgi:hypothetical protein